MEEVKLAIKPYYQKKDITKEEYKDILRKAVHKVGHKETDARGWAEGRQECLLSVPGVSSRGDEKRTSWRRQWQDTLDPTKRERKAVSSVM